MICNEMPVSLGTRSYKANLILTAMLSRCVLELHSLGESIKRKRQFPSSVCLFTFTLCNYHDLHCELGKY